jgi:hypothetical protein
VAGLLRQADRALYAAKAAGRNRTVLAPDGEPADPEPGDAAASPRGDRGRYASAAPRTDDRGPAGPGTAADRGPATPEPARVRT